MPEAHKSSVNYASRAAETHLEVDRMPCALVIIEPAGVEKDGEGDMRNIGIEAVRMGADLFRYSFSNFK